MIPILFGSETDISLLFDTTGADLFDTADKQLSAGDEAGADRTFATHGYGDLSDTISCFVEEERNGSYELELTYPIDGLHFEDIALRMIIVAKPNYTDDPQPFRIYQITKPIDGICTIYARHISYDMSGIAVSPFTASNIADALSGLTSHAMNDCPFTLTTSRSTVAPFQADTTASMRSWLGGKEGSLLDVYGGEWHFDRFTATLENSRGTDRGVVINYGHNLTELVQDESVNETFTGCVAVYVNDGVETKGTVQYLNQNVYENVYVLDVSADYETAPTVAQLDARALAWLTEHNTPAKNITLDFVQAEKLAERVDLCDTVTINYEDLGVSATAKCIRTKWNVILEWYDETEFGDARDNIAETIATTAKAVEKVPTRSQMQEAISRASNLITGNIGGYVVIHDSDGDGYPDEVLIMDKPDIETAVKVWRWNASGLGYSSTGYDGDYGLAMTIDGEIVADFITSGEMSANRISGGTLTLGGADNGNGVLQVLDADGNVIGTWNNAGANITGNLMNRYGDEWIRIYQSVIAGGSTAGTTDGTLDLSANVDDDVWSVLRAITGRLLLVSNDNEVKLQAGTFISELAASYINQTAGTNIDRNAQNGYIQDKASTNIFRTATNGQIIDKAGTDAFRTATSGAITDTASTNIFRTATSGAITDTAGTYIRENAGTYILEEAVDYKRVSTGSNKDCYVIVGNDTYGRRIDLHADSDCYVKIDDDASTIQTYASDFTYQTCSLSIMLRSSSFNSLPVTITDSHIKSYHYVARCELSNPAAQTSDWTITTSNGSLTIAGSINGSTMVNILLVKPIIDNVVTPS